jgi:PAS domain S-box-containing protein
MPARARNSARLRRACLAALAAALVWAAAPAAAAAPRVLVLHSYHHGFAWTDNVMRGVRRVLSRPGGPPVELAVEYMDTKRHPPEELFPALARLYARKYREDPPEVVISSDNNALAFLARHGREVFPGSRVVFCGVNDLEDAPLDRLPRATGVAEDIDPAATLRLVAELFPQVETIAVVSDVTPTGRTNRGRVLKAAGAAPGAELLDLGGLDAGELRRRLRRLGPRAAVLHVSFYRDRLGRSFSLQESIRLITDSTAAPVFTLWDFVVTDGVLGGVVVSGESQGREAALMARRLLAGAPLAEVPIQSRSPNLPMFAHAAMQLHGLGREDLPPGAVVLGQPESFYRRHRRLIWAGAAVALVQLAVILALAAAVRSRRRAEERLRGEHELLAKVMETSPVGITVVDHGGRVTFANSAAERVLGLSRDRLAQRSFDAPGWRITDRQGRPFPAEALPVERVRRTGGPVLGVSHAIEWPDGRRVLLSINSAPLLDRQGRVSAVVSSLQDVTEEEAAKAELARSNQELAQFASVASHDLLEPLNTVGSYAAMLQRRYGPRLDEKGREFLGFITDGVARMQALIQDLRDYGRVGGEDLAPQPVELEEVWARVREDQAEALKRLGARVSHDPLPRVLGRPSELERLLQNLLSNALKFRGPRPPRIHLSARRENGWWRLSFRDHGIGFDPDQAGRVFGLFKRLHTAQEYPGTGIGLAVCQKIVERAGGEIRAQAAPGRGATFLFTLPAADRLPA